MNEQNPVTPRRASNDKKRQHSRRKSMGTFKSPLLERGRGVEGDKASLSPQQQLQQLLSQLQQVYTEIAQLHDEGLREEELEMHITKLHEYNEIKDVGQLVMGRLADQERMRTKDMYQRYGLELED